MNLETAYSIQWLWACVAFSGLLTLLAYYRNQSVKSLSKVALYASAALRFTAIFLLSFLLLKPLVQSYTEEIERPTLIVALDQSESIQYGWKGDEVSSFQSELEATIQSFSGKFDVVTMSFGDRVSDTLNASSNQKYTDFSQLQTAIDNRYAYTNVAGVIVASDGLYNRGMNPLYQSTSVSAPLYTVLLGDTLTKKDARIANVEHNAIVFNGNRFPVRVDARVDGNLTEEVEVSIWSNGKKLTSEIVAPSKQQFIDFQLEAKELGVLSYEARISVLEGEELVQNNRFPFFIDVLQNQFRILMVAEAPHPDVKAIRRALESKQDYEVEVAYAKDLPNDLSPYQLVIAFSGRGSNLARINEVTKEHNIPVCWVVQSNINRGIWNGLNTGVQLANEPQTNRVVGSVSNNFTFFQLSDEVKEGMKEWPVVVTPFGNYQISSGVEVVAYQQVGNVKTEAPLFAIRQVQDDKSGFIIADGLWRWRIANYQTSESFEAFDELITRMIRFVLVKSDKSRFRVNYPKLVSENNAIVLEAELYDASLELSINGEVTTILTDSVGNELAYELLPQGNAYRLNIGALPVGEYTLSASAKLGEETFSKSGKITVSPITIEQSKTQADHELLKLWSIQRGGEPYYPNQLAGLQDALNNRSDVHSIVHQRKTFSSWLEQWWPLVLGIVLLSAEWFIRKYSGSY